MGIHLEENASNRDAEVTQVDRPGPRDAPPPEAADAVLHAPLAVLLKARLRSDGQGGRIGRYLVLRLLGEGGMGSVFAAYDAELDRTVAIKLLRAAPASTLFNRSWLLAEAKAMARLSHPNVAQVYDVGEVDDHVFIAMEMIQGMTLRKWLKREKRSWSEIVEVFVEAGRGLQAVHAAGLVHRDFKPQNVLVGEDGRTRVLDFGLAHTHVHPNAGDQREPTTMAKQPIIGTPAYMAPEQLAGGDTDARSDIFAFCVALYEAIFGVRPFTGDLTALIAAIRAGNVRTPPAEVRVPARVRRVIFRGLRSAPAERWATMGELLAVLEHNPWRRRSIGLAIGAVTLAVASLGWSLQRQNELQAEREAMLCIGSDEPISMTWAEPQRQALSAAFAATGLPYAADAAAAVEARLDAYAGELATTYRSSCGEHRRGELTDNLFERAQVCLDTNLLALRALVQVLIAADAKVVEESVKALASLPRIDVCRDRKALVVQVRPPDDPEVATSAQALRGALAGPRANLAAGKIQECAAVLTPLAAQTRALAYTPLIAEAALLLALCLELAGDYEGAERAIFEALSEAEAAGHEPVATEAATRILRIVGLRGGRFAEAELWGRLARGLVRRRGERPEEVARLEAGLASLELAQGRPEPGLAGYDRALEFYEAAFGRNHIESIIALNNRGSALHALGRSDELQRNLEDVTARARELLGSHHPILATMLSNLANTYLHDGDIARALAVQRDAIAIMEAILGADHPELATLLTNLGEALARAGEYGDAQTTFERVLALRERALGPDHPGVGDANLNLANLLLVYRGEPRRARPFLERALALAHKHLPRGHPRLGAILSLLGRTDFLLGKRTLALTRLEEALQIAEHGKWLSEDAAELRFFLAQALWEQPRERARARALAQEALLGYGKAGPLHAGDVTAVEAWLAEHGDTEPSKPRPGRRKPRR
jgi:tetratricopeptide (TPR) repeat protein/predicted Ser/Thr protein kinase